MKPIPAAAGLNRLISSARSLEWERAQGRAAGAELLQKPASEWRLAMQREERFRSYGTLQYLLELAHEKLDVRPTVAHELTSAVLAVVDGARAYDHLSQIALRALARKEHANALRVRGDLRAALGSIDEALELYGEVGALDYQCAKARLAKALILREMGEADLAIALVRQCARTFKAYRDSAYLVTARMIEGGILNGRKQYRDAMNIFVELAEEAERNGDIGILARALKNTATCARELGDIPAARDLFARSLPLFEQAKLTTEVPRVRWGLALCLAIEGRVAEAVSELYMTQALYLHFGMNLDAATASLDIVRIRFLHGEDVTDLCIQLVATFSEAGMAQNAIEALAYLREQARHGQISVPKVDRVREFFVELEKQPALRFSLLHAEHE